MQCSNVSAKMPTRSRTITPSPRVPLVQSNPHVMRKTELVRGAVKFVPLDWGQVLVVVNEGLGFGAWVCVWV